MKRKILIIEDEKNLREVLRLNFVSEDFEVEIATNGEEGIDKFYSSNPDLVLLDINLPRKNGWEVCREIREFSTLPVVMMTARDSDEDEFRGLNIGADDYITKPFSLKILTLKIKKLLKIDDGGIYRFESFSFDPKKGELVADGESTILTRREIQFLSFMIKNRGIIFSRDSLLNEIWGIDFEGDDRAVDTLVKRLRKKMGEYNFLLKTIRGMGYSFDENKN